jgi:dienelactone hydrolase
MRKTLFSIILLSFIVLSCSNTQKKQKHSNFKVDKGKVVEKIYCTTDSTQSYAIYIPSKYDENRQWSIVYAFDSHAKGKIPVNKYKNIAEKYSFILVASNNSQNGTPPEITDEYVKTLFEDTKSKLNINQNQIYTLGFSGGARVASKIALSNNEIKGVIACGAGFPQIDKPIEKKFNFVAVVGNEDFNYLELKNLDRQLNQTVLNHKLIIFEGKHEWPPENIIDEAFSFVKTGINNSTPTTFNNEEDQKEKMELIEQQKYLNDFSSKDLTWWKKETTRIFNIINTSKNKEEKLMLQRLMNFSSLIAYMHTTESIKAKKLNEALMFDEIYKLVDPKNSEHAYLAAQIYTLIGDKNKAIDALNQANKLGFDDYDRLSKDEILFSLKDEPIYKNMCKKNN